MGALTKIENHNPLRHNFITRRMLEKHPNFRRRVDAIWDEGITAKRARRAFVAKTRGPDYETLI
jgi:hypothetical protein